MKRPTLEEIYMDFAVALAKRSTCARLQVGTVMTNVDLTNVLAIGYNGNARGLPNKCDSTEPGKCGCIHSEQNALIKALPGPKMVFVTHSPCRMCAKMMANADVKRVYYNDDYRDTSGLDVLAECKIDAWYLGPEI